MTFWQNPKEGASQMARYAACLTCIQIQPFLTMFLARSVSARVHRVIADLAI